MPARRKQCRLRARQASTGACEHDDRDTGCRVCGRHVKHAAHTARPVHLFYARGGAVAAGCGNGGYELPLNAGAELDAVLGGDIELRSGAELRVGGQLCEVPGELRRPHRQCRTPQSVCAHALITAAERWRYIGIDSAVGICGVFADRRPAPAIDIEPLDGERHSRAGEGITKDHMKRRIDETRLRRDGQLCRARHSEKSGGERCAS